MHTLPPSSLLVNQINEFVSAVDVELCVERLGMSLRGVLRDAEKLGHVAL